MRSRRTSDRYRHKPYLSGDGSAVEQTPRKAWAVACGQPLADYIEAVGAEKSGRLYKTSCLLARRELRTFATSTPNLRSRREVQCPLDGPEARLLTQWIEQWIDSQVDQSRIAQTQGFVQPV